MRVRYSFSSRRTGTIEPTNKHRESFPSIVKKVIETSDIILEVLDARFPEETRNKELEDIIKSQGKKIIFVLNKSDLIDINSASEKINDLYPHIFVSSKNRQGIKKLKVQIKIEAKKIKRERINISIIGYPNTGKSSLINTLTRRGSARTSQESGYTKGIQKIRLFPGILLLDTPGVIPEKENSAIRNRDLIKHAKINVKTYDKVKDPEFIISELMKSYPGLFEKFYNIQANGDSEILLEKLGRKCNFLLRGNKVDAERTARKILKDFQAGDIRS